MAVFDKQGHRYEKTQVLLLLHKNTKPVEKVSVLLRYIYLKLLFTLCSKTFKEKTQKIAFECKYYQPRRIKKKEFSLY